MRPAVCASVMRNRKTVARRVNKGPHTFSWSRFFLMLFVGAALFIVGLVVTIIGIESADKIDELPGDKILYKFIGPASLAFGMGMVLASGLYYCCWGVQRPVSNKHIKKRKKAKENNEQYDPLQPNPTPAVVRNINKTASPNPNSRSRTKREGTPDQRGGRNGNGGQRYRTSSRTSLDSQRSHQSSRHRHNSNSRHSNNSHVYKSAQNHGLSTPTSEAARHKTVAPTQVTFINTNAPLADGESGSVDISIDIDTDIEDKKY